ncbi:hypothetical protein wTpre_568 [Wolbachia endosymbiont of Trichogramma pretiosum]|nr:hypothetical protein wTpre_568 [Wolbachia endosymbiont of Trichogramma pretiosum]
MAILGNATEYKSVAISTTATDNIIIREMIFCEKAVDTNDLLD